MESVYFGKETVPETFAAQENDQKEKKAREYYFPNEKNTGLRIKDFISVLFLSSLLDVFIFVVLIPFIISYMKEFMPLFNFVGIDLILVLEYIAFFFLIFLIIGALLRNSGRRKVYVMDNGTFYVIKHVVRVYSQRRFTALNLNHSNELINKNYARIIRKIDKWIDKGSHRIKKVLTDCKESDSIHEGRIYYSGYNEKTLNEEEFAIPSSYVKFDPATDHHVRNGLLGFILFILKTGMYVGVFTMICLRAKESYHIYLDQLASYKAAKEAVIAPMGFYEATYGSIYDHLDYFLEDDTYKSSRIKFGFQADRSTGLLRDEFLFIDMYLNEGDDIGFIKSIIRETGSPDVDPDIIDDIVEKFYDGGGSHAELTVTVKENTYFTVKVDESDNENYDLDMSVYLREIDLDPHIF